MNPLGNNAYANLQRANANPQQQQQQQNPQFPMSTPNSFPQTNISGQPQWNQGQQIQQQQMMMSRQWQFQQQQPPQSSFPFPQQNLMSSQNPINQIGQQNKPNYPSFGIVQPQSQQQNAYPQQQQIISQTGYLQPQMQQQQPYQLPRFSQTEQSQSKQQQFMFSQQLNFNQVPVNQANPNPLQQQYPRQQGQPNSLNNPQQQQQILVQNGQFVSNLNQSSNIPQKQQQFQRYNTDTTRNMAGSSSEENNTEEEPTKLKLIKVKINLIKNLDIGGSEQSESLLNQKMVHPIVLVELKQLQHQDLSEMRFILKNNNLDKLCFKKLCFIVQFLFMAVQELDKKRPNFWKEFISIFQQCEKFSNDPCFRILKLTMADFQKLQENNTLGIKWVLSALKSQISTFALSVLAQFFIKAFVEKDPSLTAGQALIQHFSKFCVVKVVKDASQVSKEKSSTPLPMSVVCLSDYQAQFAIFSSK